MNFPGLNDCTVAILGLGYVGLPLAIEFSREKKCLISGSNLKRKVLAYDINIQRIKDLKNKIDRTNEISDKDFLESKNIKFTSNINDLLEASIFIVTVPTPIDEANKPDLSMLISASKTVAKILHKRLEIKKQNDDKASIDFVIYESTVYPGATEEVCIPIIETYDGLKVNNTFAIGYSPERINPGDKSHNLVNTVKVTSGSSLDASDWIARFYGSIIDAGIFSAKSIRVAEAAKVIENTQRDINIALVNELAMIFSKLKIDTIDVLETAKTKWNFLDFKPGLVGGHCIGVDPYYLTYKAEQQGYYPEMVLAGRRINNNMSRWICDQIIKLIASKGRVIKGTKLLILGMTFKENCPDMRNTKIIDIVNILSEYKIDIEIYDPYADLTQISNKTSFKTLNSLEHKYFYDVVLLAVAHDLFCDKDEKYWKSIVKEDGLIFDLKGIIPRELVTLRL